MHHIELTMHYIHSFMVCTAQRLQAQTSVTSYTSDIYYFNSRLTHLYALWMEYVRFELESWWNMGGARTVIENRWFTHSVSSADRAYQVVHKSQMSAFEVVGAFFYYTRTRVSPPSAIVCSRDKACMRQMTIFSWGPQFTKSAPGVK